MPLRRSFAPALAMALALAVPAQAQKAPLKGLDAYVTQAMKDWQIPGLSLAVVRNDTVIYQRGYGVREVGKPDLVDENTLFNIASTTKAFTTAALGMLVDAKKVRWDDPVTRHLPGFQLQDPWITRELTVRDLVTHRAGLARTDNLWLATPFDRAEVLKRAAKLPQQAPFRSVYGYNNIMFLTAGEVVGAASGMSWDDFVEQRIFRPLGMTRTTSRMSVAGSRGNVASPHYRSDSTVVTTALTNYDNVGGAGAIFSSAHDMAQWLRLQLNSGLWGNDTLIRPATVKELHTPQIVLRSDSIDERLFPTTHFYTYGLGWFLQDYRGYKLVNHSGSLNYMKTEVGLLPEKKLGVFITTNLTSSNLQLALMYRIFDMLLGGPTKDWSGEYLALANRSRERAQQGAKEAASRRVMGTKPSLETPGYQGTYSSDIYGDVKVSVENGHLVLDYSPDYIADLEHYHYDTFQGTFRRSDNGKSLVTFNLDARGRAAALTLEGFGEFKRVFTPAR